MACNDEFQLYNPVVLSISCCHPISWECPAFCWEDKTIFLPSFLLLLLFLHFQSFYQSRLSNAFCTRTDLGIELFSSLLFSFIANATCTVANLFTILPNCVKVIRTTTTNASSGQSGKDFRSKKANLSVFAALAIACILSFVAILPKRLSFTQSEQGYSYGESSCAFENALPDIFNIYW